MQSCFQGGAQLGRGLKTILGILRQHSPYQRPDVRRQIKQGIQWGRLGEVLGKDLRKRAGEWHVPGEHCEDCGSKRVDVRSNVHLLAIDLFRAGIIGSTMKPRGGSLCESGTRKVPCQEFCESKINELCPELIVSRLASA